LKHLSFLGFIHTAFGQDVLDINGGSWARILPSGDPGSTGNVTFPQPRSGAASITFSSGLVGSSRGSYSDTIIFGGQDSSGNYLSDMWVLRAYGASVTQSGQQWSGFGSGNLQTGVNANGAGVSIQYITTCAKAIGSPQFSSPTGSVHGSPTNPPSSSSTSFPFAGHSYPFDTSSIHKSLTPISLALLLPTVIFYRLSLPPTSGPPLKLSFGLRYASVLILIAAYGAGLAGLVSSFTSISTSGMSLSRRAATSNKILKTAHGQVGLALFIALYALIPLFFLASFLRWRLFASPREIVGKIRAERSRADSSDTAEKLNSFRTAANTSQQGVVRPPATPSSPGHTPSRKHIGFWFRSKDVKASSETASESESPVQRTFEVVNRPTRTRHPSSGTPTFYEHAHRSSTVPRNLSELSWLERRRSVNVMVRSKVHGEGGLAEVNFTGRFGLCFDADK
jgi:hypothetical protein